jgi:hypothetical protein
VKAVALTSPLTLDTTAVADMNGDGKTDLLIQNTVTGVLTVWLMDGTTRTAVRLPNINASSAPQWRARAFVDIDGNGTPDLIWENPVTDQLGAWFMDGTTVTAGQMLPPDSVPGRPGCSSHRGNAATLAVLMRRALSRRPLQLLPPR